MKYRSLQKWDDKDNTKGLIFVAQLIDELLFDFTLDTYKPSAMNTCLLAIEALSTIASIKKGTIKKPNLKHILDELCENLENDHVAKSLINVDLSGVKATLMDPKSSDQSINTTVELLAIQMQLEPYKKKTEELLYKELSNQPSMSTLRSLTRSYITTLINCKFSTEYIKRVSQKFFFYSGDRIGGTDAIKDYFELFSLHPQKYGVLYKGPKYLLEFQSSGKRLGIDIQEESPDARIDLKKYNFRKNQDECFLYINEIESLDIFSAKSATEGKIELLQTLIGLYHHKETPKPITECLAFNKESQECRKVSTSINPMHKCQDMKPGAASKKLYDFISSFSMQRESFQKFNRSAELHALALSSESRENQMINLWISLESLIPSIESNSNTSQIEHISKSLIPFLNLGYIDKLIMRFTNDLYQWNSPLVKSLLKDIKTDGVLNKATHFLVLDEHEPKRARLKDSFRDFHLLRNRFEHIHSIVSDPMKIISTLDAHKKRVDWQLRRIYRARNTIVHDGTTPTYVDILIENTHDYLDSIMNTLMRLAATENTLNSIEQGFKMVELNYFSYYKAINEKGLKFDINNIDRLFFMNQV